MIRLTCIVLCCLSVGCENRPENKDPEFLSARLREHIRFTQGGIVHERTRIAGLERDAAASTDPVERSRLLAEAASLSRVVDQTEAELAETRARLAAHRAERRDRK